MRICIVYIWAYIGFVCIGMYIHAQDSFYAVATLSRGALLFLATIAAVSITFAACRFRLPLPYHLVMLCRFAVPFAVPLRPNTCNVHFIRF